MELLAQLGINSTVGIQFCVFVTTIFILRYFVFSKYAEAAEARHQRTRGGEDDAAEMIEKAASIKSDYEKKAREINAQISQIFQAQKSTVAEEADKIVSKAKAESASLVESTRKQIQQELTSAEAEIAKETHAISAMMVKKLLGKPE